MTFSRTERLLVVLQDHYSPREDGWLWLAMFVDDADHGVIAQFDGPYEDAAASAHALARIIRDCGADRAYLALCRREARPTEADRQLWRVLRGLVDTDSLLDLVVFNGTRRWSMRAEDAAAA